MTDALMAELVKLDSPLRPSYLRTLDCCAELVEVDGQLRATRCKNRHCLVCNRIRTKITLDRYAHLLVTTGGPAERDYFVTLTIPNVIAAALPWTVRRMQKAFQRIARRMKGAASRPQLHAIRKTEVTYNAERDDFHPHLHAIVRGEAAARMLEREWLAEWPDAVPWAQRVEPLREGGAVELFKYFTKLFPAQKGDGRAAPVWALDVIFRTLKGLRTVEPYGLFRVRQRNAEKSDEELMDEGYTAAPEPRDLPTTWWWERTVSDWVDPSTGELLAWYEPSARVRTLVDALAARPPDVASSAA